jgi:hypothetical protein
MSSLGTDDTTAITAEQAAIDYLARGWAVFPCYGMVSAPNAAGATPHGLSCQCAGAGDCSPGKHPLVNRVLTHGLKQAAASAAALERIWPTATRTAANNLAIAGGAASGVIFLDIDPKDGGGAALEAIIAAHGPLPTTVEAITGSGGRHYYFAQPRDSRTVNGPITARGLADLGVVYECPVKLDRAGKPVRKTGIDIKGDGGYVIAPPSLHPSGQRYRWAPGRSPSEVELAPMPEWMIGYIRSKQEDKRVTGERAVKRAASMPAGTTPGATEGSALYRGFDAAGWILGPGSAPGSYTVICPWEDEHTPIPGGGHGKGAAIFPPAVGANLGGYVCLHNSCKDRRTIDDAWLMVPASIRDSIARADRDGRDASVTAALVNLRGVLRDEKREPTTQDIVEIVSVIPPHDRTGALFCKDLARFIRKQPAIIGPELPAALGVAGVDVAAVEYLRAMTSATSPEVDGRIDAAAGKVVMFPGGRPLAEEVEIAIAALARHPNVYQFNGRLVYTDPTVTVKGIPCVNPLEPSVLKCFLSEVITFNRTDKKTGEISLIRPPNDIVDGIHARHAWAGIRQITGVLAGAALRPDGTVISAHGYDPSTGYYVDQSARFPEVPENPTREDAGFALDFLDEVFRDFPYSHPAARHVPVAAILTMLARPAIRGAIPAFIFDAADRGSGKTLQVDVIATIATGRTVSLRGWPSKDEEVEKVIGAIAAQGRPVMCWDNIDRPFGGAAIDMVLTAHDTIEPRTLGKSETPERQWRTIMLGTGNNITWQGDTIRRVVVAKLEVLEANAAGRDESLFLHHPLLPWVEAHRLELVGAALTILKAFCLADSPPQMRPWTSYGAWSNLIASAIRWAGGEDITPCWQGSVPDQDSPDRLLLRAMISYMRRHDPDGAGCSTGDILAKLYTPEVLRGEAGPSMDDDTREAVACVVEVRRGCAPSPVVFGRTFSRLVGKVHGIGSDAVVIKENGKKPNGRPKYRVYRVTELKQM